MSKCFLHLITLLRFYVLVSLVDLPRLPSNMRIRSRSILRSKILADQTLRVMGVEDLETNQEEQPDTAQDKNDLVIEDDINPC